MKKTLLAMLCMMTGFALHAEPREYDGQLLFGRRTELSVPVSGVVQSVAVDVAEVVKKDQVLFMLDPRPFNAKVADARAELARAEQKLQEAQRELDRAKELYDRTVLSNTELEQAQTAYLTRKAAADGAKARLQQAKLELDYSSVRAPYDGIVAQRRVEVGQTIVSRLQAEPLLVLVDHQHMLARIDVRIDELEPLGVGKSVMVKVGSRIFPGRIAKVGVEPARTQEGLAEYEVDVEFMPGDALYRAGQNVKVVAP